MPITIPPVPEGIPANNLYGEVYGDLPPLAWSNPDFHSRLAWMQTQVAFTVTAWYSPVNAGTPGFPALRLSTMFRAEVAPGLGLDFDVRNVMGMPDALVFALMKLRAPEATPQTKPYPGFAALNPATESPIGPLLNPQPWPGRTLYASAPGDTYVAGNRFETPDVTYEKVMRSIPGQGPFGTGGRNEPAWQVVYRR